MSCLSSKPVKDWEVFSELVEAPFDPQSKTSSDRELFSEIIPQIIGDPQPSETPIHLMLINVVRPYTNVDNPTFKVKVKVEGV